MTQLKIETVALAMIRESDTNPRKTFPEERLAELRESMRESGLIQPLTVRPRVEGYFEIVAGATRYRCARELGWESIDCVIREMDDREVATVQMAENVARRNLNAIEEAGGLARMRDLGMAEGEIARSLGMGERWVQGRLALCDLPEEARVAVADERLSIASAEAILRLEEPEREEAVQDLLQFGDELTTAQVVDRLRERYLGPRARRKRWAKWCEESAGEWADEADPVEDPEDWSMFVHAYGRPTGRWRLASDAIGGAAARESDAGLTWGDLAMALGIRGMLVPAGGVPESGPINVVHVVDGGTIMAAEKAAKKAGKPYTLGRRVAEEGDDEFEDDEFEDEQKENRCPRCGEERAEDGVCENLDCAPPSPLEEVIEEAKEDPWNPWAIAEAMDGMSRGQLELTLFLLWVVTAAVPDWFDDACGWLAIGGETMDRLCGEDLGGSRVPVAIWWLVVGRETEVRETIVERLGLGELWVEGGAK